MSSDTHGATWSEPKDITTATKARGVGWISTMDSGVQLASGRLAIPMDYIHGQWSSYPITHARSSVLYSDDQGARASGFAQSESEILRRHRHAPRRDVAVAAEWRHRRQPKHDRVFTGGLAKQHGCPEFEGLHGPEDTHGAQSDDVELRRRSVLQRSVILPLLL